mmetsp:Transcript_17795/g.43241  ORF Transcript_17795/g.43241 Transcript_17795/m.43241 type:complete len:99 (+) Transcript_17795:435-731(+)
MWARVCQTAACATQVESDSTGCAWGWGVTGTASCLDLLRYSWIGLREGGRGGAADIFLDFFSPSLPFSPFFLSLSLSLPLSLFSYSSLQLLRSHTVEL